MNGLRTQVLALAIVALAASVAMFGCSSSSSPTSPGVVNPVVPPGTTLDAVDQDAADDLVFQAITGLGSIGGTIGSTLGGGGTPGALSISAAMSETTFVNDGLTYEISRTFYGPLGGVLPNRNGATRLVSSTRAYGVRVRMADTVEVASANLLDFRGLPPAADTCVMSGNSADTLESRFRSMNGSHSRHFLFRCATTISNVKMPLDGSASGPVGGSVTIQLYAERLVSGGARSVDRKYGSTVSIVFYPDHAEVTVNGTFRYRWTMGESESLVRI